MNWAETIRRCFESDRVFYSGHARREMREEEFGAIADQEVYEAIRTGEVLETYPADTSFPSVLLLGVTQSDRPIHVVCAYDVTQDFAVVITVYQPDPNRWEDYRRRRK